MLMTENTRPRAINSSRNLMRLSGRTRPCGLIVASFPSSNEETLGCILREDWGKGKRLPSNDFLSGFVMERSFIASQVGKGEKEWHYDFSGYSTSNNSVESFTFFSLIWDLEEYSRKKKTTSTDFQTETAKRVGFQAF